MSRRGSNLLIAIVLLVAGLGTVAWYGPKLLREAGATGDWPSVEGAIESSEIRSQTRGRGRGTDYVLVLTYSYELEGQRYRGSRWSVGGDLVSDDRAGAEIHARSYRVGDRVPVYYDPEDPTSAVLAVGGQRKAWATIAFGALLVVAAGIVMMRALGTGR
jgi:hypothetical protein